MLTLLINETKPLAGLFASTTGGIGSVPDISVADEGQAVSVQTFTRTAGVITDSFVAGDVLHIGIGDGVNAPVCYIELSSASPATGTMAINTVGMVALFAATVANRLSLQVGVVRTRGGYTNTIFSAPIVIHRSVIDPDTAVPTPSILGTGVAAALLVAINTALGFVRLDASARLPAVDGSQLTNVPNELPSQTGNSGKYLTTNGTATSWATVTGVSDGDKGDITVSNSGATWTIDNDTITLAKLAHMTTARVVGRTTAGTGTPELLTISGTGSVAMTNSPTFTTPNLDTPSAIVLTNATGTASININGTVGATTPATVAGTTITGTSSLTLGTNGGTGGSIVLNGSTSGSSTLSVSATGALALPSFTVGSITVGGGIVSADRITAQNPVTATAGIDINPYNSATQVTAGHPWMRLGGVASEYLMINAGLNSGYVDICADLGSGMKIRDGTGGHETFLTTPATGTLRITTDGSTLGTLDVGTITASSTTSLLLGTAGSAVGNIGFRNATSGTTTLAPATGALGTQTVTLPLSGTLAISSGANTFTGVQSMTSPDITTSITTPSTTFALVNATATTVNFAGAATTIAMGAAATAGSITLGKAADATGTVTVNNTTPITATATGALLVQGGAYFAGGATCNGLIFGYGGSTVMNTWSGNAINVTPTLQINKSSDSTSLSTGALVVAGGAAITKSVIMGGTLAVTGASTFTGDLIAGSATMALLNTTATTVNFAGGASTALNIGNASGTNTVLGSTIFSANPVTLSGNQSRAAWTTTGTGLVQAAASYTDTSSSGTVAVTAINNLAQPTLLASSATTYTDSFVTRMAGPPVASTNVTQTRAHTLGILDSTTAYRDSTKGALVVATAFGTGATSCSIGNGTITAGSEISISPGGTLSATWTQNQFYNGGGSNMAHIAATFTFQNASNHVSFAIGAGASGYGYLTASAVSATACALTATGSGSNIDINLTPKGTGAIVISEAGNFSFGTTTGTKIGATTSQKLSFWNATPIVQPTTAVASATVASPGAGSNIKTDDTFDGYTIAQVVKALRNAGLLA
jgi:hypothetical protein